MPRFIDIGKVLQSAGETKAINLDVSIKQLAASRLVDIVSASYEPWDLICADWITIIRKGPRLDSVLELMGVAESLRAVLGVGGLAEQAGALRGKTK
jgi:hypothetical protein